MKKRVLVVLVAAVFGLLAVVAPGAPHMAGAQPEPPVLSVYPSSGPCDATVAVTGNYFLPSVEWPPVLTLYLVRPGTADVSMVTLDQADFFLNVRFGAAARLWEQRGCEAATLDSQLERPTGHLTLALAEGEPAVEPGERIPSIISWTEYAYTSTTPQPRPTMVLSPSSGPCDATVEIAGREFPANTAIRLDMGTPKTDSTMGQLASLTTDSAGQFVATVALGALGCRAAALDDYYSGQLWIFADLVGRVVEPGQGIPPILTSTQYVYTTTGVGTPGAPAALPATGGGPCDRSTRVAPFAMAAVAACLGMALIAGSLYRGRKLRD